ncbi:MAG: hypothetical protein AAFQ87_09085 [Bacteroidota bacterium]
MSPEQERQIEAYAHGQMNPEEERTFETACQADSALQTGLDEYLLSQFVVARSGSLDQKAQLRALREEMQVQTVATRPLWRRYAPYAAAAVLALILLWAGWQFGQKPEPEALFAQYYEAPLAPESLGVGRKQALQHYANAEYEAAIQAFETAAADSSLQNEDLLYWAIAHLEVGEMELALARFAELQNQNEVKQWYEALIYLKQNRLEEVRLALQAIVADEGHYYQKKAQELLGSLE